MTVTYTKIIKACIECPNFYCEWDDGYRADWICKEAEGRAIGVKTLHRPPPPIPDWCPLRNKARNEESENLE